MTRVGLQLRNFLLSTAILVVFPSFAAADDFEFFEKRIRPILIDHCFDCHSADDPAGNLNLESKAGWQRGGQTGPAIVPGDPASSLLMRAVSYSDESLQMPPSDSGDRLSDQQLADLSFWIRRGAADPRDGRPVTTYIDEQSRQHWAFQPLQRPEIDPSRHPIDQLVERQLDKAGLLATDQAPMETLIRRATYDLHGLPPTVDQRATPPQEFAQLVDRLLESPRYGERWGRHWLDVARYSDAKDGVLMYGDARIRPFAYTYRDYVIRAFNEDKPFDQFVREQLAADQLELAEDSPNLAAMGLLTLGRMFDHNRHDVIDDQIDVVTRGFLGLTVSCARCHDHKFDPIPTADYYSLYGVFASGKEPYQRPRVEPITDAGKAFEEEFAAKLRQVDATRRAHYQEHLQTARDRTADYLVEVATTEPDLAETAIYFKSLLPDQLRPQIVHRWRKLIAQRAYPDDPIFGPWYDLMREPVLRIDEWRGRGVDERVIDALMEAKPQSPGEVARVYGEVIREAWGRKFDLEAELKRVQTELLVFDGGDINLADIVAGGNGFGGGQPGRGIHPASGEPTEGETGFVPVEVHDQLVPVDHNPFVDGVFVPQGRTSTISTTGISISDLRPSGGQTWDYIKYGPSSGFTTKSIDGVDFSAAPNSMLSIHANKGITFDLNAFREKHDFEDARFVALLGHVGAAGQSTLDVRVYLDGKLVWDVAGFRAQQSGAAIDVELPSASRFLTLVVLEGGDGISHDQAILGNPRLVIEGERKISAARREEWDRWKKRETELVQAIADVPPPGDDPLTDLLLSQDSPVWFSLEDVEYYLSRQQRDAYRGMLNELDAIGVRHPQAAGRAMVMVDRAELCEPRVFHRGDPSQPGASVPRRYLQLTSEFQREPFTNGAGRLGLAESIASPDNPLTARVWANRVWMHHFGQPLVENPSDFGLRTEQPLQHELLDFLASYLIDQGWRTKPLHRLIMTSQTWQRSTGQLNAEQFESQQERDPDNQWLWRGNRRRLDLEQMRDAMLFVSGQLEGSMYGRPAAITDLSNRRRTVYAFVERQNVPNVVQVFDFASPDTSSAQRVTTTVPQQALFAMNSDFVRQAAESVVRQAGEGSAEDRVSQLFKRVLGRDAEPEEQLMAVQFVEDNSWVDFAQVLLMTNEFMFVD